MIWPLVITFSFFATLANSINFFSGILNQHTGEIYLGTTHYFEDYFFYLSQFFQGAHGVWLTANRYTAELTQPSILFWPNVLLGKIGGVLGLSPILSYNLSVIFLTFIILVTIYAIQRRIFSGQAVRALTAFLITITATSFMNRIWVDGKPMWYPFQLWKTPNFALDRLGSVPHQLVQTLLFLLLVYVWFFIKNKKLLFSIIITALLTSLNPVMTALFFVAAWLSGNGSFINTIVFAIVAYYYNHLISLQPHVQSKIWEASQQLATTPLFLLLSIGPVSILGVLGIGKILQKPKSIAFFGLVLLIICYLLFFSPIPKLIGISNSRVLFPALYIFWGALATEGLFFLSKKKILLIAVFFLLTIQTLVWEIQQKLVVKPEERIPLLYLPKDVYSGFAYLASLSPLSDVVAASPTSHMDAMVPAFTGHTSYTGHPFATIDSDAKRAEVSKFFQMQMDSKEAERWLKEKSIRYVLFTKFDGDISRFENAYPFLKKLFTTGEATIWNFY